MKIGVIGLGLIGGSFALSAKKSVTDCSLFGMDNNAEHLRQAFELSPDVEKRSPSKSPSHYAFLPK